MKKIKSILVALTATLLISPGFAQSLKPVTGLEVGNQAPDLKMQTPEGKELAISSLHGKLVLVDFWASWCGPCRMENPNLVKSYQAYKNSKFKNGTGFTIYSVSLDKAKEPWIGAIKQDGLVWTNHVSDLKWWYSDAARTYGVQSIPTNWLIDANGIIIAKNLRGPMLDEALQKYIIN